MLHKFEAEKRKCLESESFEVGFDGVSEFGNMSQFPEIIERIKECRKKDEDFEKVLERFNNAFETKCLDLSFIVLDTNDSFYIKDFLFSYKNITKIDFSTCNGSFYFFKNIVEYLLKLDKINDVNFGGNVISDTVLLILGLNKNIEKLSLNKIYFGSRFTQGIVMKNLFENKSIKKIYLNNCLLNNESLEIISRSENLTHIHLSRVEIPDNLSD